jgi:hypothetical protein
MIVEEDRMYEMVKGAGLLSEEEMIVSGEEM